ncbi:MAG: hypothetical protein PHE53_13690 [Thermoguttaceae bacterium]|nr:hypothetical protein [Thermoguttaceae bacterium]
MALHGLAYSVRMAAYNRDGNRVSGLASTLTATLWADGVTTTLTDTITEIGSTGVYVVPLTATQMEAYNICVTATSTTAGITLDPVVLDTEDGRIDVATSTRLATSGYTVPPTTAAIAEAVGSLDLTTLTNAAVGSLKTLILMGMSLRMEDGRLNIYETDGLTLHASYTLDTATAVDPIIGVRTSTT